MKSKYLLGYDVGSSSIKASLIDADTGKLVYSAFSPQHELAINSKKLGWAEQDPDVWWEHAVNATKIIKSNSDFNPADIAAIGVSYQMHGLVAVDKNLNVLRSSIIWCDSRAVEIGDEAFDKLGNEYCLSRMLNSPGNFTASKLKWVKDNEPEIYKKIYKIMLPGEYIAAKLTGEVVTTISGLSEGIFWDFKEKNISKKLLDYYQLDPELLPEIKPLFSVHGEVTKKAAEELGLVPGIKVAYRAGDQPNNAFSLNVLNPGEIASTAGTSGVVYGVNDTAKYDNESRVNTFAHVTYTKENPIYGILLCINGTGILNSWVRNTLLQKSISYDEMNKLAASVPVGSEELVTLPFGNGAERVLNNKDIRAGFLGLNFNTHSVNHILRSVQEGIVFSFNYGIEIMKEMDMNIKVVRAGNANMFLSPLFCEILSNTANIGIELYNTDGSQGAARGAGVGAGYYSDFSEAFKGLNKIKSYEPDNKKTEEYNSAYQRWLEKLKLFLAKG